MAVVPWYYKPIRKRNPMATTVTQTYSVTQNVSVTQRDGVISLVTIWSSSASADKTVRIGETSAEVRRSKR